MPHDSLVPARWRLPALFVAAWLSVNALPIFTDIPGRRWSTGWPGPPQLEMITTKSTKSTKKKPVVISRDYLR